MIQQIGDNQEYAEQAAQSAQDASQSAQEAETAAESIETASVVLSASSQGSGVVTINASINRG